MPVIRFRRTASRQDGSRGPATGSLTVRPSRRRVIPGEPDEVIMPVPFPAALVDGVAEVTLDPTDSTWAWVIVEKIDGVRDYTYYVMVPDVAGPLDDTDLVRTAPGTLDPLPDAPGALLLFADTDGRPYFLS